MRQHQGRRAFDRSSLTRLQRDVLGAVRDEELSYPEVAVRLGITVAAVEAEFAAALVVIAAAADDRPPA